MPFILQNIRNGQETQFSITDLLKLIGDPINDEIKIGKKKYRISSCQEISSGGSADEKQWVKSVIEVNVNGQAQFDISLDDDNTEGIFMVVNNMVYDHDTAFYIDKSKLYWTGEFSLETTDEVYIKQLKNIQF